MTHRERLTRGLKTNRIVSSVFSGIVAFFSLLMVVPLVLILGFITFKGLSHVDWNLFASDERGGGVLNAMVGSAEMVLVAVLLAVPVSVLTGMYLAEARSSRLAEGLRITVDVFQGIPSIVLGIIAYVWLVVPLHGFSGLSGAVALAIMMVPIIIKSTEESLALVPDAMKEAAYALGAPYHLVMLQVVLPAGLSGVVTGVLLATARILGETAPLLFTSFGGPDLNFNLARPMEALPPLIFKYAQSPRDDWVATAWASSFVLVVVVLLLNLITKGVLRRWKR
jgi:phosphate transport system permease protein